MKGRPCTLACVLAPLLAGAGAPQTGTVRGTIHGSGIGVHGSVVYLVPLGGSDPQFATSDSAVMDQAELSFLPPVLPVLVGTTVEFRNSDSFLHNVFSPDGPADGFDLGTYPRDEFRARRFTKAGTYVILCHVHPEMAAYVVVLPTPYFALVDRRGSFEIAGVPSGPYAVHVWNRRAKAVETTIEVGPGDYRLNLQLSR